MLPLEVPYGWLCSRKTERLCLFIVASAETLFDRFASSLQWERHCLNSLSKCLQYLTILQYSCLQDLRIAFHG